MKHICIWQEIRRHFISGFSDRCGIFDYNTPRRYNNININKKKRRI